MCCSKTKTVPCLKTPVQFKGVSGLCSHIGFSLHDTALTSICGWHRELFTDNDFYIMSIGLFKDNLQYCFTEPVLKVCVNS